MEHKHHHQHHNTVEEVKQPVEVHEKHSTHHGNGHEHMHDKHAGHHTEDFLKRFWICLILTIPVLLLSEMIQHWFGFSIAFASDKYVLLALGTAIYFYG